MVEEKKEEPVVSRGVGISSNNKPESILNIKSGEFESTILVLES
jgi:DNA repair protein RadA/Sms